LAQSSVGGKSDISQRLIKAGNRAAVHFVMLSIPAVYLHDGSLITVRIGIHARTPQCLSPISSEPLDMLGIKPMAERMGDNLVGHHPTMPCVSKTPQTVDATRRLKDSLHALHDDNRPVSTQADCHGKFTRSRQSIQESNGSNNSHRISVKPPNDFFPLRNKC
jgi:hypothetical protein